MFSKPIIAALLLFLISPIAVWAESSEESNTPYNRRWTDLLKGSHYDAPFGVAIGYVNKGWSTDFGNRVYNENMWGEENKRLHGMQLGFIAQPCLKFGLGLHAGLFYEWYYSVSQVVLDAGYDNFTEHNFYIPIHAMYRMPITRDISLSFFGGIGMNWAFKGSYNEQYRYYYWDGRYDNVNEAITWQEYGKKGEWPRRLNLQWEVGATFRYNIFQLSFTYSRGITNHHFYEGYKTKQNKLDFTLTVLYVKKK